MGHRVRFHDPEQGAGRSSLDQDSLPLTANRSRVAELNPTFWAKKKYTVAAITIFTILVAGIAIWVTSDVNARHHATMSPSNNSPSSDNSPTFAGPTPMAISSSPSAPAHIPSQSSIPATLAAAFRSSSWIWQDAQALVGVPSGDWAFRKTLPASTTPAKEAIALLTVDNGFQLYHNGQLIAENSTWQIATAVHIDLDPNFNVFAIQAHNSPLGADPNENTPAGLLASIQISYADGSTTTISSDDTWRVTQPIPDGFQSPSFGDTLWQSATTMAAYGSGPWGNEVVIPLNLQPPAR